MFILGGSIHSIYKSIKNEGLGSGNGSKHFLKFESEQTAQYKYITPATKTHNICLAITFVFYGGQLSAIALS